MFKAAKDTQIPESLQSVVQATLFIPVFPKEAVTKAEVEQLINKAFADSWEAEY